LSYRRSQGKGILPQGGFRRKPNRELGMRNEELGIRKYQPPTRFAARAPGTPMECYVIRN